MSLDSMRSAISQAVREQGGRLASFTPSAMAVGLASAALLPTLAGDLATGSTAAIAVGLLGELGLDVLQDLVVDFFKRLRKAQDEGEAPSEDEIREQLEQELLARWEAGGAEAVALRADVSRLLQTVQGVEAALEAATGDMQQVLAQGLADLGGNFQEFRWMLDEVQQALVQIRTRQALQLALQKEQLDLQRQQLVKTNLLLQFQQVRAAPAPGEQTGPDEVLEDAPPAHVPCPYKGLAAFEPEDAEYFFGREELVAEMTARLPGTRFLAVLGPSGSGKSSLVRAGLLPAVWQGALPDSRDWQTLILTPGQHPLEELAVRMSVLNGFTPTALLKDLETDPRSLDLIIRRVLAEEADAVRLLLIIDQFEEVFALCRDEAERRQFIRALLHTVEVDDSRTIVVPTIRTDFYGRCTDYPSLATRLQSEQVLVGSLSADELPHVIERPAELVGLHLEPGLVETIVSDVAGEPGALPLLSHALLETWQRRRGRTLTLAGYTEAGGVAGAIAQTADTAYEQLPPEQQDIARGVFLRLTELGEEGTQDTRRRAAPGELIPRQEETPAVETVLKRLADARLITTGKETVEVAHEALIREWPKLREWLEEDREGLRIHRHLTGAAQEWERLDRDPGELYRGARLAMASEWAEEHRDELNPLERTFLEASQEAARRREAEREAQRQRELEAAQQVAEVERQRAEEQTRASRRLRWLAGALAAMFLLAVGAAAFARVQQQESERRRLDSLARALAAQAAHEQDLKQDERAALLTRQAYLFAQRSQGGALDQVDDALRSALGTDYFSHILDDHQDDVTTVALSPDNQTLASGSTDETIRLWEVATGQPIGEPLTGHAAPVRSVAFDPDGKILASGGDDGTVRLWNVATGQMLGEPLAGHTAPVLSVAFSPDGQMLASASEDATIWLWDATTSQPIGDPLTGHAASVLSVAFSPDGQALASGSADETIRLWEVATGEDVGEPLAGHTAPVQRVAFSPDGQMLASASEDTTVRLWEVATGQPIEPPLTGHTTTVFDVAFSPDGKTLASSSEDKSIRLWDVTADQQGRSPTVLEGHEHWVLTVAFSPDGETLASGSRDTTIRVWNLRRPGTAFTVLRGHKGHVNSVAFGPEGQVLASGGRDKTVRLWDLNEPSAEPTTLSTEELEVRSVDFQSDGQMLAAGGCGKEDKEEKICRQGQVRVWDLSRPDADVTVLPAHEEVRVVAFSPDGQTLASGGCDAQDGKACRRGDIRLWELDQLDAEPLVLQGHEESVTSLTFSPDGETLASGSRDTTVRLWSLDRPSAEPVILRGHNGHVNTVAFSSDGKTLASGDQLQLIRLWDVSTGEPIGDPLTGHADRIISLAFNPDGSMLASGSEDETVQLWDVSQSGVRPVISLRGHDAGVRSVTFSPNGRTLASSSKDGTIVIWVVRTEALADQVCETVWRNLTQAEWNEVVGQDIPYERTCPNLP